MSAAAELRERVREARLGRKPTPAPGDGTTMADAYSIQAELFADNALRGYKLGLVSAAKQRQMAVDRPIYGRVSDEMLLESPIDVGRFIQPRMEPEIAVVLNRPLAAGCPSVAVDTAIGAAFLAVDFLDCVWEDYRFKLPHVVADNASGGGFLLGERALPFPLAGSLRLLLDGELVGVGSLDELGDVAGHLAWLAGETGGLAAGTVVFLGSPAAAAPMRPGLLELHGPGDSVLVARLEDAAR